MCERIYHYLLITFFFLSIILPFALIILSFIIPGFITKYNTYFTFLCGLECLFIVAQIGFYVKIINYFEKNKNKENKLIEYEKSLL
jgi:hypothetical protein